MRSAPVPLQGHHRDLLDEPGVVAPRLLGGQHELGGGVEPGVGIHLQRVPGAVGLQPEVDAGVVAHLEGAAGLDGGVLDLGHQLLGDVLRKPELGFPVGRRAALPLHLGSRDPGRALGQIREVQLHDGKRLRRIVPQHSHV